MFVNSNINFFCPVFASWFLGGCVSVVSPVMMPSNLSKQLSSIQICHIFCGPCSIKTVIQGIRIMNENKSEKEIKVYLIKKLKLPISKEN
jgi:hypothetical protein